jgi:mitochondrial fission protein ELM1
MNRLRLFLYFVVVFLGVNLSVEAQYISSDKALVKVTQLLDGLNQSTAIALGGSNSNFKVNYLRKQFAQALLKPLTSGVPVSEALETAYAAFVPNSNRVNDYQSTKNYFINLLKQ